ncbi:hypothetical protein ACF1BS_15810 [Streptomyces sp. NPDC014748]|uniref:hypothetical protein n=1 Tax=Streptomyces sp. NPDC014748 TaxID=3364905 RepID=UPI0036FF658A
MILSRGGGFLPYTAYRFSGLTSTVVDRDREAEDILRDLKRLSTSARPVGQPLRTAGPARLRRARPRPLRQRVVPRPQEAGSYYNQFMETYPDFTPGQAGAIDAATPRRFPRLAR